MQVRLQPVPRCINCGSESYPSFFDHRNLMLLFPSRFYNGGGGGDRGGGLVETAHVGGAPGQAGTLRASRKVPFPTPTARRAAFPHVSELCVTPTPLRPDKCKDDPRGPLSSPPIAPPQRLASELITGCRPGPLSSAGVWPFTLMRRELRGSSSVLAKQAQQFVRHVGRHARASARAHTHARAAAPSRPLFFAVL